MNGMVIRPQDGDSLNLLMGNKGQRLQHTWDIFMSPERRAQQAWGSSPWEHSSKLCETRIRGDKLTNRDEVGGACAAEEHPPSPRPKEENFQRWHFFLFLSFNCVGGYQWGRITKTDTYLLVERHRWRGEGGSLDGTPNTEGNTLLRAKPSPSWKTQSQHATIQNSSGAQKTYPSQVANTSCGLRIELGYFCLGPRGGRPSVRVCSHQPSGKTSCKADLIQG